jgi:hypothetical protein
MFLSNEWCNYPYSTKQDERAILKLTNKDSLCKGVEEVYTISKRLVKLICFIDGEKPKMGYLYEAMVRPKKLSMRKDTQGTMDFTNNWCSKRGLTNDGMG